MSLSILAKLGMDSKEFKKGLNDAGNESKSFGEKLKDSIGSATKVAGLALAGLAIKGTKDMIDFQKSISEVFTLLPGISKKNMGAMSDDVRELARSMGLNLQDAVKSLYQAISAGVDPNNAVSFLKTSAKTAIGGVASLEDSVGALTTVINGYGMSATDATKVSDVLFSVVKNGVTSMTELGQNIGKVTPIASALGVSLEEVGAMFAVLTKQMGSGKTAEAGTAIRSMLAELSKEGMKANENFKALGQGGFKDFIKNGGEVGEALMMMKKHAEKSNKSLMDMFRGVEAGNGALMLTTQGGKELSKQLKNVQGDAGATEKAFGTMEETVSRQIDKLMSNLMEMGLKIGEAFLPVIADLVPRMAEAFVNLAPVLAEIAKAFADVMSFVGKFGGEVASAVGFMIKFAIVAKTMMIIVSLAKGIRVLVIALQGARVAQLGLNTAMMANPIGLIVGAVALLVTGIMELISANDDLAEEQKQKAKEWRDGINKQIDEFTQQADLAKKSARELAEAFAKMSGANVDPPKLPLAETRDLVAENKKLLSSYENQRKSALRGLKYSSDAIKLSIEQNAHMTNSGRIMFDNIQHEQTHAIHVQARAKDYKRLNEINILIFNQKKKILDLENRETFLAKQRVILEQDIAKAMDVSRKNFALTRNEAGKIVVLGRQIRDLEFAKKKIIDDARNSRVLETNEAVALRNVEADILAKRLQLEDIIKNKLKVARQDELNAVKDIITELRTALQLEEKRADDAKANAEAKEEEVKALRENLVEAQKALDKFKGFFNKDIRGKLKLNVGELAKEFKKLKAEGKLPANVQTLKDFEMLVRHQASLAKIHRDQIIEDGIHAKAQAEEFREAEDKANKKQEKITKRINKNRKEVIKLEENIEGEKRKTLKEMTETRKELERVWSEMQDVNLLPKFDATIVEAIETQAENLKRLDHNVADLVGKNGAINVEVDLDETDINKESTQTQILETLNGYFVNQ